MELCLLQKNGGYCMFKTRKRDTVQFETPQEMYDDYKNREINGIQAYQSKVLDNYLSEGIDKKDVALELPTGTGKTLIGLLIGEFRRRKYKEKVVYICPTSQLVYQTANYANEKYGIKVVPFTGSKINYESSDKLKYTMADNIAITNYSSIFNVNSFFVGADILIFDDAHSGENYIAKNWTVTINRNELKTAYWELFDKLKSIFTDEQYRILTKENPKKEDITWCDMIHNSKLFDKYLIIQETLDQILEESNQRYSWYNIRNNVYACNIYLSWENIVIRPYISPTLTNNVFSQAKHRIYMSATLGRSGEIERAYGIEKIHRLAMVKEWKNKDIGRRFFLFPLASFKKDESINIMCKIVKKANRALILVNDFKTQSGIQAIFHEQNLGKTYNGKDIERSKEEFINSNNSYAVIANRFDGIDFPNEECRVLILFDIPTIAHIQEKFMITRLAAKTLFDERIKTRIVQAIGRCTRSQTDYAAVCVLSDEIMNYLLSPKNLDKFNFELQAEIIFGHDNSTEQTDIDNYLKMLDVFLEHKAMWDEAEEGILSIRDDLVSKEILQDNESYEQLGKSVIHEVRFQYALWKQDYVSALNEVDYILKILQENSLNGYRGYWNYIGGCCAFSLYKNGDLIYESKYKDYFKKASESTIAVNWFKYEEKNDDVTDDFSSDSIIRIEQVLLQEGRKGLNKFYDYLNNVLTLLRSKGTDFEKGHELLGTIAGFRTTNPKGQAEPDPIWIVNRNICIVAEDKIYDEGKLIPPNHVKEASSHALWVKNKAELLEINSDAVIIPVFVTTSEAAQENTTLYGEELYYLNVNDLISWAEKLVTVIKEIYRLFSGEGDSAWREYAIKLLIQNKLTPRDYINMITKKKLTDL